MAIYKDPSQETAVRIEAAKATISYEKPPLAAIDAKVRVDDHVPLADRIKSYLRDDAIEASAGKVVPLPAGDAFPATVATTNRPPS